MLAVVHGDDARPASASARKRTFPIAALKADTAPFRLQVDDAELSDRGSAGVIDDARWELRWEPGALSGEIVHPLLERARIARTMMVVPQPDLAIEGTIAWGDTVIELSGARGGQTHLWGAKHASRWCWLHASDLEGLDGAPRRGDWIESVSVVTPRAGREVGPSTPVTGVLLGEPFDATGPLRVLTADADIGLTRYTFETRNRRRRLRVEVDAPHETLVGVTYDDPDGEQAWCYNSEVASLRAWVWDRGRGAGDALAAARHAPVARPRTRRVRAADAGRRRAGAGVSAADPLQPARAQPLPAGSPGGAPAPVLPPPFTWREGQIAIGLPGGHALFTTRAGGDLAADPTGGERLRALVGPAPEYWAQDHQVHEQRVRVIAAGEPVRALATDSDGIATARRDVACLVRTADCVPIALIAPEAVAMLHAGWRGLAAGVVAEGVGALRGLGAGEIRAAIGPHARVCCYETGDEVHAAFAALGPAARRGRRADLEAVTRALLSRSGVDEVHAAGLCTICSHPELLWSHRREGARAGPSGRHRMAQLSRGLDSALVRRNLEAVREEIAAACTRAGRDPAQVEVLAAVKYVALEDLGALADGGVTLAGENRAQDLVAKAAACGDRMTFDFIGHLQSRKVRDVLPHVRLIHSVASDSVLDQLARHGTPQTEVLVEVNVAGEESKSGIAPRELDAFIERCPVRVGGLMTMPPLAQSAEASRRWFAALAALAGERSLPRLSMGTTQDFAVAVEEGATIVRIGSRLVT